MRSPGLWRVFTGPTLYSIRESKSAKKRLEFIVKWDRTLWPPIDRRADPIHEPGARPRNPEARGETSGDGATRERRTGVLRWNFRPTVLCMVL